MIRLSSKPFHTHDSATKYFAPRKPSVQKTWWTPNSGGRAGARLLPGLVSSWAEPDRVRELLIFKGGTALKLCHFGDYRFSEDLDFTLARAAEFREIREGLEEILWTVRTLGGGRCSVICSPQRSGAKTCHKRGLPAATVLLTSGTRDRCRDCLTQIRSRAKQNLIPARLRIDETGSAVAHNTSAHGRKD